MSKPDENKAASILLVDDTAENLRLLSGILLKSGYDPRPVMNGNEALLAAAHEPPDLVLLDVIMPGMTGFEVCAKLREVEATRDVPVIFLTGATDVEHKVRGFAVGGTDYITKPFQVEEVLARVGNQLALRRARKDLERTVQRLTEMEQLRDDLVHMIVHDMRSPLTSLLGYLGMVREDVTGDLAECIGEAERGARRVNDLASSLLDVSRLEEGRMPLDRKLTDLVEIATASRAGLLGMEEGRAIEVTSGGPAVVDCDPAIIRRVVDNLVSNGIKHTPGGGMLRIKVEQLKEGVRVSVQDDGPGVPRESRRRIFEKFGAAAVRKDKVYHSVGLGLAFCKLAIEAHGGSISVEDAQPRGSVFAFELPA